MKQLELPIELSGIRVGVDWLTVSSKDMKHNIKMNKYINILKANIESAGETPQDWSFKGYKGWSLSQIRYGVKEGGATLLMVMGDTADALWDEMPTSYKYINRIDLAVTVRPNEPLPNIIKDYYRIVSRKEDNQGAWRLIEDYKGGETLYLGSRQSERYGRIYDKGIQSKEEGKGVLIRYEVEVKGDTAKKVFHSARDTLEVHNFVRGYVWDFFVKRGVRPLFSPGYYELIEGSYLSIPHTDKTLTWLKEQVRPAVNRLERQGRLFEASKAIGYELITLDESYYKGEN